MKYSLLLLLFLCFGCEFFKPKEVESEKPIAKSVESLLYASDLEGLFPANITGTDSVRLAEKYVEDWIKKQLMIHNSIQEIDYNEAEIERKVLDYRYALIVHAFEKKYIDENLNMEVNQEIIEQYYQEKSDNFLLKQNIVKCLFAQVPKNAPNINQFRRNFRAYPEGNTEDLKSYIAQFATKSFIGDSTWVIFDDLILTTPLETMENKNSFLTRNKYSETSTEEYVYFLSIFDYKITDEISPLEFIQDDIRNIIINKRKLTLKKELEENIYENAKKNGLFEIYSN